MSKPWERVNTSWSDGVREFYAGPQPTQCDLTNEELQEFYRHFKMDDKPWRVAGELRDLRGEVARLQARARALAAALREVVESAHTDADRCPICGEELHAHASGCSIAAALAAVSAETEEA